MKTYGGVDEQVHEFLISAQLHTPAALSPVEKNPSTHCLRGWMGTRPGLHSLERRKILPLPGLHFDPSTV
jgi:hypothetical protein